MKGNFSVITSVKDKYKLFHILNQEKPNGVEVPRHAGVQGIAGSILPGGERENEIYAGRWRH